MNKERINTKKGKKNYQRSLNTPMRSIQHSLMKQRECPFLDHTQNWNHDWITMTTNQSPSTTTRATPVWSHLFPPGKIKAQLTRENDVGKLSQGAIQLISISSALFLQHIVQNAAATTTTTTTHHQMLTIQDIQNASPENVRDHLGDIQEVSAPKRRKRTSITNRTNLPNMDAATRNQVTAITTAVPGQAGITVVQDDDDYD